MKHLKDVDLRSAIDDADCLVFERYEKDKASLISEILREMLFNKGYAHDTIQQSVDALLSREQCRTTGLANGVAIPHGCVTHIEGIHVGFVVVNEGMDFNSCDGKLTFFLMFMVYPPESAGKHVQVLAWLSARMRANNFIADVKVAQTPEDLRRTLAEYRSKDN